MKQFSALLLWVAPLAAWAQATVTTPAPPPGAPAQTARTELLLDHSSEDAWVQAMPADTAVVVLLRRQPKAFGKAQYALAHYRAGLTLRREQPVEIPDEYDVARLCAERGVLYAVCCSHQEPGNLLVLAYNVRDGRVHQQEFKTKKSRDIAAVRAVDGKLLATVALDDGQHQTVLLLDVANGSFQFLPSLYESISSEFTSVADAPAGRAEFVASQTNGRKQRLMLKQLSAEGGELLRSETVQAESERTLITAQLSPLQDTSARLLAGTYGLRGPQYAQGVFTTDLTAPANPADPRPALKFYDFRRLRHFFDYLGPGKEARLRGRTARREAEELSPLRWHYRLLLHELKPRPDGGYTLVAEVYYPRYNYGSMGTAPALSNYSNLPLPYYTGAYSNAAGRALVGFRTTHVLVCGFDRRGSLLWDNTYVVENELLHDQLEEAVRTITLPDGRLVLAYLTDEGLHYKLVNQDEASPNNLKVELFTAGPGVKEKVLDTYQPDIQPWTGSQYVASGFQNIRSQNGAVRHVFFLQTLEF
ncbi:MAG TPA: hypothetical protein VFO93_00250 [Hymenobacter sp.]|uniref:hypothetical protein n=1 Tax=Hymenobacter sp. TaxID=1898978 RepID=UPI002D7F5D16|nr:hypothetical protein [Hymenobacter sp.]HET9501938.1 hypothetical protein [Hymenobacter sp.]